MRLRERMPDATASLPWAAAAAPDAVPEPGDNDDGSTPSGRQLRRQRVWLQELRMIAASYGFNGLCLVLFWLTGAVHGSAAFAYAVPGWMLCIGAAVLIRTGRAVRWTDAGIALFQTIAGASLCLGGLWLYPEVGCLYVLALFTVFLSATYRTSKARSQIAWGVVSVLLGLLAFTGTHRLQIPHATGAQQLVAWLCFTVTLSRCVLLSVINTRHTLLLRQHGEQMARTLAEIERLAHYDELTGLPNRRHLLRQLDEEAARATRDGSPLAIALLDLDHFKAVNDQLGHLVGDRALQCFAQAVDAHRRTTDRFGRHGGEEFLLLMPATSVAEGERAIERLRDAVAAADWERVSPGLRLNFSAGLAAHHAGDTPEQLLARADRGLYGAKDAGRNCLRVG